MKKVLSLFVVLAGLFLLTACWPGEVGVFTEFNANGSGKRTYVLDVMDDLLSDVAIPNPEDPNQDKGKGDVQNDKYVTGGVVAIQTWLEENAPEFITVEAAKIDGYHRYFTLSFEFKNFDDFLDKIEKLVNLSPTLTWDDFTAEEKPSLKVSGGFKKTFEFFESNDVILASIDWAIAGLWEDIIDPDDLTGWITQEDIFNLAEYQVEMGGVVVNHKKAEYDPTAQDDENLGKIVYLDDNYTSVGEVSNTPLVVGIIIGGVALVAALGAGVYFFLIKKRP